MSKSVVKRIFRVCVAFGMLYMAFALGVHLAWWINNKNLCENKEVVKDGLPQAVSLAQEAFDSKYGKDAFLYGLRRIVRDGDKMFYGFFVASKGSDADAKMLVEVDMTCQPAKTILRDNLP